MDLKDSIKWPHMHVKSKKETTVRKDQTDITKKKKRKKIESINLAWSQGTIVKNLPSLYILQQTIQK